MTGRRLRAGVLAVTLVLCLAPIRAYSAILPAAALYADAQAKERAVRRALSGARPNPAVLKALRTVVAEYESVVRHYPATAYCDDALWNAAQLSLEAFRRFGDSQDQAAARRLFKRLSSEYPTSQWARQAVQSEPSTAATKPPAVAASASAVTAQTPLLPRPEPARPETAKADVAKTEAAKLEAPKPDAAKVETPTTDATKVDARRSTVASAAVPETAPALPPSAPTAPILVASTSSTRPLPASSDSLAADVATAPSAELSASTSASAEAASEGSATITRIERRTLPDVVRLTISVSAEVTYREQQLSGPPRVFFDFLRTRPSPGLQDRTLRFEADSDIVRVVRVGRHPNQITRVVLDTTGASACSAYPLYVPYRLVVDCVREAASVPSPPAPPAKPVGTAGELAPRGIATRPAAAPVAAVGAEEPKPIAVALAPPVPVGPLTARLSAPLLAVPLGRPLLRARTSTPLFHNDLPGGRPRLDVDSFRPAPAEREAKVDPLPSSAPGPSPAAPTPPSGNLAGGYSMARQLGLSVSRIVIDPGHGGHDPGAKGPGVTEASLVLDIALRLEQLLKQIPGTDVILTRRGDVFVPLEERTAMANREGADLFLSIHANASAAGQVGGVETYFLNFATTRQAAAVAARENAASGQPMNALPDFVKAIALNNKLAESRDFATEVQRSLVQRLKPTNQSIRDLGVKQAPFVVLIGAAMPSVLSEVAFVTNEQEARLLRGNAYRQKIAEALSSAIQKYQASLTGNARATMQQQP